MTSLFIDVHSHLDHELFSQDVQEVVRRAKEAGVCRIITNGINPKTNRACLSLSQEYDIVECGMGVYPRDALRKEAERGEYPIPTSDFDVDKEISFMKEHKKNVIAISEVGLDFVNGESKEQIVDFQKMIQLSLDLGKPMVVHSRKAEEKCVEVLESFSQKKVVMHCFCGKKKLVKRILDNGWFLTIPTSVVRAQQFQEIVGEAPLSQLFCETDSPYLSPFKGERNEPSFVVESYKKIAELKKLEVEEVAKCVFQNWQRVFQ